MFLKFLISFAATISMILVLFKLISGKNKSEKIVSFYFLFTLTIVLVLANSALKFGEILDIVFLFLLLALLAVLFLNNIKKEND